MSFLTTSEGNTLYYEHHRPKGKAKATIVISCAFCTTHENWRGQVEALVGAGHPVVLWDHRGHGQSPAPENDGKWSLENVMTDLGAIADATTREACTTRAHGSTCAGSGGGGGGGGNYHLQVINV